MRLLARVVMFSEFDFRGAFLMERSWVRPYVSKCVAVSVVAPSYATILYLVVCMKAQCCIHGRCQLRIVSCRYLVVVGSLRAHCATLLGATLPSPTYLGNIIILAGCSGPPPHDYPDPRLQRHDQNKLLWLS